MPGIIGIINAVSLDVTATLVAQGLIFNTFSVTGATNASPVVLTLAGPHGILIPKASVVVSGVAGNTAANGTFLARTNPAQPNQLTLYSVSPSGVESPVVGNGAYTSGGIVQTAFSDGGIVVGRVKANENWDLPRVTFIPKGSRFGARSTPARQAFSPQNTSPQGASVRSYNMTQYGGSYSNSPTVIVSAPDLVTGVQASATAIVTSNGAISRLLPLATGSGYLSPPTVIISDTTGSQATATANLGPTAEMLAEMASRSIATDFTQFEVQVWAAASPGDYSADFDATQTIYQQVIASAYRLAPGQEIPTAGSWFDSRPTSTQMDLRGHTYIFQLEFATPILDTSLGFANPGLRASATLQQVAVDTASVEVAVNQLM